MAQYSVQKTRHVQESEMILTSLKLQAQYSMFDDTREQFLILAHE